jgi:hypothetical protein
VALDAGDRARLQGIESGLLKDDPALVQRFRTWGLSSGPRPLLPGWSVVPGWALLVFLVASCTWAVSPVLGVLVVAVGGILWLRARAVSKASAPRRRGAGGGRVFRWPDHRG